jgi:hypothetical protein
LEKSALQGPRTLRYGPVFCLLPLDSISTERNAGKLGPLFRPLSLFFHSQSEKWGKILLVTASSLAFMLETTLFAYGTHTNERPKPFPADGWVEWVARNCIFCEKSRLTRRQRQQQPTPRARRPLGVCKNCREKFSFYQIRTFLVLSSTLLFPRRSA